uniref:Putative tail fiber protein n=1 Tax=viral metagenome TaxID=1070528 RepID=A0A6M3JVZ1_9ZZZZ
MSTVYIVQYVALCRDQLQDAAGGTLVWSDAQLEDHMLRAVKVFSKYYGNFKETILPVTTDSKEVNITALDGRTVIDRVEFYVDRATRKFRNWDEWGNYLTMTINFDPSATADTLTGTVSFTNGSTAVTGSGTLFTTEVEAGEYIHKALDTDGECYKVKSVTSATALVLDRAYGGTTGADTASKTELRTYDEVCRIFWAGMHSVAAAATTIPTQYEQVITDGACAYALEAYASYGREAIDDAIDLIVTMDTQIDLVGAQVTLLVSDVALGRADLEKQTTAAETALTSMGTALGAITTYAAAADDNVAAITVANEMANYAQLMNAKYQEALGYLQQFQGYISEAGTLTRDDLNVAVGELNAIMGILNHSKGYGDEIATLIRANEAVLKHSINKAAEKKVDFQKGLDEAAADFIQKLTPYRVYSEAK